METSTFLESALLYADNGINIIPLVPKGKVPLINKWKENASVNKQQIIQWWTTWPNANIGIVTGEKNGIIVIDIDIKNSIDGMAELIKWEEENQTKLPTTLKVKTGSGGYHLYYKNINDKQLRGRISVLNGVDIRGEGGYVVAPSSINEYGNPYEWIGECNLNKMQLVNDDVISLCNWNKEKHTVCKEKKCTEVINSAANQSEEATEKLFSLPDKISMGERNLRMNQYVGSLIGQSYNADEIKLLVTLENRKRCKPPLDDMEITNIINNGLKNYRSGEKPKVSIDVDVLDKEKPTQIFLTDKEDICQHLCSMNLKAFHFKSISKLDIVKNKDNLLFIACGNKYFNDGMNNIFAEEQLNYCEYGWRAFTDKNLLQPENTEALRLKIDEVLSIKDTDGKPLNNGGEILYEKNNCYMFLSQKKEKVISNFCMKLLEYISVQNSSEYSKGSTYKIEFTMANGKKIIKIVSPNMFSNARTFKNMIKADSIELSYTGGDYELELIQQKMIQDNENLANKSGIEYLGLVKRDNQWVFVDSQKTVDSAGNKFDDIVSMTDGSGSIATNILDQTYINQNELKELLLPLTQFNLMQNVLSIIGWCVSAFFKERLIKLGYKFPHLIVSGEAGSGKSSIVENIVIPLFSILNAPLSCDKLTQFSSLKALSSSNAIPVIFEEFKPSRIGPTKLNLISNIMRDSYDGHSVRKGTAKLNVIEYIYRAPLILVGESGVDEKAIKDRSIETLFSINNRLPSHTASFVWLKQHSESLGKLGRVILNKALSMDDNVLAEIMQENLNYFEQNTDFESRNKAGLATVFTGLRILKLIVADFGMDFEAATNISRQQIIDSLISSMRESSSDGEGHTKTEVEKCIEIFDVMAKSDILQKGIHYQIKNNELQLYIKEIYILYSKYYKDYGLASELDFLNKNQFCKQLKLTSYYITTEKRKFINSNIRQNNITNPKCFVLDIDKLNQKLELDMFQ